MHLQHCMSAHRPLHAFRQGGILDVTAAAMPMGHRAPDAGGDADEIQAEAAEAAFADADCDRRRLRGNTIREEVCVDARGAPGGSNENAVKNRRFW